MAITPTGGFRKDNALTFVLQENEGAGYVISGFESDTLAERISSIILYGGNTALFRINAQKKLVYYGDAQDYEANPAIYNLSLLVTTHNTDPENFGGHIYHYDVRIAVGDIDEQPSAIEVDLRSEQMQEGFYYTPRNIGTVRIVDDALGTNTLTPFNKDSIFEYRNTDGRTPYTTGNEAQIWTKSGRETGGFDLDYETGQTVPIRVAATTTGIGEAPAPWEFVFTLTDLDEHATAANVDIVTSSIPEGPSSQATLLANITMEDDALGDNGIAVFRNKELFEIRNADGTEYVIGGTAALWLKAGISFDHETEDAVSVVLRFYSSGLGPLLPRQRFTFDIADVDDQPTEIHLSTPRITLPETLPEQLSEKRLLADITFTDIDSQANNVPYFFAPHTEEKSAPDTQREHPIFAIEGDAITGWKLYLKAGVALNYESATRLSDGEAIIKVHAPDALGDEPAPAFFHLDIEDQLEFVDTQGAEIPKYVFTISEDVPAGTVIGRIDANIPQGTTGERYTLSGAQGVFDIVNRIENGNRYAEIIVAEGASLDYEAITEYNLFAHVETHLPADEGNEPVLFQNANGDTRIPVDIKISNVIEAPVFTNGDEITITINEGIGERQRIYRADALPDADPPLEVQYFFDRRLIEERHDWLHFIISVDGHLTLVANPDFETQSRYVVVLEARALRAGEDPLVSRQEVTILVNDIATPTITGQPTTLYEGVFNTRTDTGYRISDFDAQVSYNLSDDRFEWVENALYIKAGAVFDYEETNGQYSVTINAQHPQGGSEDVVVNIAVEDVSVNVLSSPIEDVVWSSRLTRDFGLIAFSARSSVPTAPDHLVYTLSGEGAELFYVTEEGNRIRPAVHLDPDITAIYNLTLTIASARTGESVTDDFTITLNRVHFTESFVPRPEIDWNTSITIPLESYQDLDGDAVSLQALSQPPADGTVTIFNTNGDNYFTYTPDEDYWGVDSFTINVRDARGATATPQIDVFVRPSAPEGYNLIYGTHRNDTLHNNTGHNNTGGKAYIYAGRGHDTINGSVHTEVYVIERNNGLDTINESPHNLAKDTIYFKGIDENQVHIDQIGNRLVIGIGDGPVAMGVLPTANRVRINDWSTQFDTFKFDAASYSADDFYRLFDIDYAEQSAQPEGDTTPSDIL